MVTSCCLNSDSVWLSGGAHLDEHRHWPSTELLASLLWLMTGRNIKFHLMHRAPIFCLSPRAFQIYPGVCNNSVIRWYLKQVFGPLMWHIVSQNISTCNCRVTTIFRCVCILCTSVKDLEISPRGSATDRLAELTVTYYKNKWQTWIKTKSKNSAQESALKENETKAENETQRLIHKAPTTAQPWHNATMFSLFNLFCFLADIKTNFSRGHSCLLSPVPNKYLTGDGLNDTLHGCSFI